MNRLFGLVGLVCPLFSCGGPAYERQAGPGELDVVDVWVSSRHASGGEFGLIRSVALSRDGDIWVADDRRGVLEVLFGTGRPKKSLRLSAGDREFSPTRMSPYADGMAVLDAQTNAVYLIEDSGQLVGKKPLGLTVLNPKGFVYRRDGSFLVTGGTVDTDRSIFLFDSTGRAESAWHGIPRGTDSTSHRAFNNARLVAGGPISMTSNGSLLYSNAAPQEVLRFGTSDTVGTLLASDDHVLQSVVDDFDTTRIVNGEEVLLPRWDFPQATGVFELPDGRVVNVMTRLDERLSVWEVYEPDGTLVARKDFYRTYRPWGVTDEGDLVVSERIGGRSRVGVVRLNIREGDG